jgi:hypothetical protein
MTTDSKTRVSYQKYSSPTMLTQKTLSENTVMLSSQPKFYMKGKNIFKPIFSQNRLLTSSQETNQDVEEYISDDDIENVSTKKSSLIGRNDTDDFDHEFKLFPNLNTPATTVAIDINEIDSFESTQKNMNTIYDDINISQTLYKKEEDGKKADLETLLTDYYLNRLNSYHENKKKPPAILAATGTAGLVTYSDRQKPVKKPKTKLKVLPRKNQTFNNTEIQDINRNEEILTENEISKEMGKQQQELENRVKQMVQEAKKISSGKKVNYFFYNKFSTK